MALKVISYIEARAKGLKRYYTGRPCKNGHLAERFVSHCGCIECAYERTNKWAAENLELKRQFFRDWRKRNPEYSARWDKENPDARRIIKQKWYRSNAKGQIERAIKWAKEHPENRRTSVRNRTARKKLATGSHTAEEIIAMLKRQKWKCAACKVSIRKRRHIDHIIPLSRGGSNDIKNLQGLCPSCNCSKNNKDPHVWAAEIVALKRALREARLAH